MPDPSLPKKGTENMEQKQPSGKPSVGYPLSAANFAPRALGGLQARDKRRARVTRHSAHLEPPIVPHDVILRRENLSLAYHARNLLRSSIGLRRHSMPPRVCYRLHSLERPYTESQPAQSLVVFSKRHQPMKVAVAEEIRPLVRQVLIVDKRLRIVLAVAQQENEGVWGVNKTQRFFPKSALLLVIGADKGGAPSILGRFRLSSG